MADAEWYDRVEGALERASRPMLTPKEMEAKAKYISIRGPRFKEVGADEITAFVAGSLESSKLSKEDKERALGDKHKRALAKVAIRGSQDERIEKLKPEYNNIVDKDFNARVSACARIASAIESNLVKLLVEMRARPSLCAQTAAKYAEVANKQIIRAKQLQNRYPNVAIDNLKQVIYLMKQIEALFSPIIDPENQVPATRI